jgi:hypothetical protein
MWPLMFRIGVVVGEGIEDQFSGVVTFLTSGLLELFNNLPKSYRNNSNNTTAGTQDLHSINITRESVAGK